MSETWRYLEWEREFRQFAENGNLPALSLVRFGGDHTGDFAKALDGVDTPERQVAANDYALGQLVEAVAKSRYAKDTLIFVVEDDAQDGPDHVDEHRSVAFVIGPYVRQGAVVGTRYSTVNMLRTMEDILGIDHISFYTAKKGPMADAFDPSLAAGDYRAILPDHLRAKRVPLPRSQGMAALMPTRDGCAWAVKD